MCTFRDDEEEEDRVQRYQCTAGAFISLAGIKVTCVCLQPALTSHAGSSSLFKKHLRHRLQDPSCCTCSSLHLLLPMNPFFSFLPLSFINKHYRTLIVITIN